MRWFLVELGIAEPPPRTLGRAAVLAEIQAELTDRPEMSVRISRDLILGIREWTSAIEVLEREIQARIAVLAPTLLGLTGCGPLSAAKLVGETGVLGPTGGKSYRGYHSFTMLPGVPADSD